MNFKFKIINADDPLFQFQYGIEVEFEDDDFWHPSIPNIPPNIVRWCTEMFSNNYQTVMTHLYFSTEEDRTCFLLRWG
jgi:hypothetical protein